MNKDYSILVVDDSIENLTAIIETLRAEGFSAVGAENGISALEKSASSIFDLFIIDVIMPEMGGLDLLKELHLLENTHEAIMITGAENLNDAKKSMELGAFGYISKPIKNDEILMQVNRALRMVEVKKQRMNHLAALEKKVASRSAELESMVLLLENQGRQLDAIINSMDEGVMAVDNQKSIVLMNRRCEQITGLHFADCAGLPIDRALERQPFANRLLFLLGSNSVNDKNKNILPIALDGGTPKYYSVNVQGIVDEKGIRTGDVLIFSDQTDIINTQLMRDSFLSITGHELRTPISISMNYLELLQHQWNNDETRNEAVRGIQTANRSLMYLVNRIISLANLSDQTYAVCRSATDIGLLVASKIRKIQSEADEKNIKLIVDNRLTDTTVPVDPYLLKIALKNVLDNAIKFSRDNAAVRVVLQQRQAGPDKDLSIAVVDEGEGLSERAQSNLFECFFQGEDPLTRVRGGLGIGLYLAKKAMEFLGGSIELTSEKGKGSTFTMHIPVP